jgi:hypothetical protein
MRGTSTKRLEARMDTGAERAALERKIAELTRRIDDLEEFVTTVADESLTRAGVGPLQTDAA